MRIMFTIFLFLGLMVFASPVMGADDVWYLRVDTDHASWAALKTTLETKYAEILPNNTMSITPNLAGTEAVVKIVGATPAWRSTNGIDDSHDAILGIHHDNAWATYLFGNDVDWKWPDL